MKGYVVFIRCVCSCFHFFFITIKKYCINKKIIVANATLVYRFYKFFGEEKRQGEESIVSSWSGFCGQESLYLKFTFMFLCEIFKFLFSFICREMSSDDEEVGAWWMYFHFSVLLNFILSICCLLFYRNHYHQKFLKLSRLTLKVSDDIMLLFTVCGQQEES